MSYDTTLSVCVSFAFFLGIAYRYGYPAFIKETDTYKNTITHSMSQLEAKIEAHTIEIKRLKTCIAELPNNFTILLKNSEEKMKEIQVQKENHHAQACAHIKKIYEFRMEYEFKRHKADREHSIHTQFKNSIFELLNTNHQTTINSTQISEIVLNIVMPIKVVLY